MNNPYIYQSERLKMIKDFAGKTVIITGASAGVGAATARAFAALQANLVLIARGQAALDVITTELSTKNQVLSLAMDVANTTQCREMVAQVAAHFGSIDILVNNAGYHQRGDVEHNNAADLAKMVDVNLRAPIELTALVLPYLKNNGAGAIINVGSLAGRAPLQGASTYAATKAGLRAFTYSLADELLTTNISVGVVSPGPIDTGFIMSNMDEVEDIVFSQPMSSAEQVAEAILAIAKGEQVEISLPKVSGWLTMLSYLFPRLRRAIRPSLYKKGRKAKEKYRQR
jgi:short-subunit dehydrogenase